MIRGFDSAASGMLAQSLKQDMIANNITNAQTAGYKRQRTGAVSFAQTLDSTIGAATSGDRVPYPDSAVKPVTVMAYSALDQSEGPIEATGNTLDLAINGEGSFEVASTQGVRFTRGGSFRIDADKELATADGAKVQGQSGNVKLPEGKIEIAPDGTVSVDGNEVDKLKLVGGTAGETEIVQGALEGANVSVVRELTDMVSNMRAFEANQKVITNLDHTLDKLINEAGKV